VSLNLLFSQLNRTLNHLYLDLNDLGDVGAEMLAKSLMQNSTIQTLALMSNSISDAGATALADLLKHNSTITGTCPLKKKTTEDTDTTHFSYEALNLGYAKATKVLNGHANIISDKGAEQLAVALECNTSLRILDLTANLIGSSGLSALGKALHTNSSLQHLILVRNKLLSFEAASSFRDALQGNTTLIRVRFFSHITLLLFLDDSRAQLISMCSSCCPGISRQRKDPVR